MPINTIEYAKIFQTSLDKQVLAQATSGWMEANAGLVEYNGGDEVKIPTIATQGLGDYDRDDGYVQGAVTLKYDTYKMTQDRGRKFQLDTMDVNETNFVMNATAVMGEFQRTRVIPEIDSYRYSKIFSFAKANNKVTSGYTPSASDIRSKLTADVTAAEEISGDLEGLVVIMSVAAASVLDDAHEAKHFLDVVDFANGGIYTRVKAINGVPILRVPSSRMKALYNIYDGTTTGQEDGGLVPATGTGSGQINWLVLPRTAPIAVSKQDVVRIFDPMTHQKANAWLLDYRRYHDLWIKQSQKEIVLANAGTLAA